MEELLHADIFFFVTTIAIILITAALLTAIIYAFPIIKDIRHISARLRTEIDATAKDFEEFRASIKSGGARFKNVFRFLSPSRRKRARRIKKEEKSEGRVEEVE